MNRPRSRRVLLASLATTAAAATGGFHRSSTDGDAPSLASGLVPDDWYECREVTRPNPIAPIADDALEPREYPTPPSELVSGGSGGPTDRSSLTVRNGAVEYATAFERAYRQNSFLARYGSVTRFFELRRDSWRASRIDSPDSATAVLVAIVYDLTKRTRHSSPSDEWDTRVVYYLDDRIALRVRYEGIAEEPTFSPDPRRDGDLVACFETVGGSDPSPTDVEVAHQ